jgi:uncharacterized protein YggU (UPF0235/DUF167 family)
LLGGAGEPPAVNWSDALSPVEGGTEIRVFCQPRAARTAVVGLVGHNGGAVKAKVHAPALEGRANRVLLELMAGVLGVPPSRLALVAGPQSRWKRLVVTGLAPPAVAALLARSAGLGHDAPEGRESR